MDNRVKEYNILFSIPVHERPSVIIDTILNFMYFNSNCAIVLHESSTFNFDDEYIDEACYRNILGKFENVMVNPHHLRTGMDDIIQCHIDNFRFASKNMDFKYFVFSVSNELFVRKGLYEEISQYDCGPKPCVIENDSAWFQATMAKNDTDFLNALNNYKISNMYGWQTEGGFLRKTLMESLCNIIEGFYDYEQIDLHTSRYAREEIFFPTFLSTYSNNLKMRDSSTTYINWEDDLYVSIADILNITKEHEKNHWYSVKRIPRSMSNIQRVFIRDYIGGYKETEKCLVGDEIENTKLTDEVFANFAEKRKYNIFLTQWLKCIMSKQIIGQYMKENNFLKVAIYGFGKYGRFLYRELIEEGITVMHVIDMNFQEVFKEDIMIEAPYPNLDDTDILIITPVKYIVEIEEEIKRHYDIPYINIIDLVEIADREYIKDVPPPGTSWLY